MAEIEFSITDNSGEFKKATDEMIPLILEEWALAGERFAKEEITKVVYDTPESPTYRRTGNLRNSLTHTTDASTAYIGTDVEYAVHVEFGTTRMKPRPYLKPAVEAHVDEYKEIALNRITNA